MRDWQLKKQKLLDEGIRFPSPANMSKEEKVMSRDSCPENRIFDSMSILTYAHSQSEVSTAVGDTAMEKVKSWMKEYHPAVERFYRQFGWKYCPIKRSRVAKWIKATRAGGIQDQ